MSKTLRANYTIINSSLVTEYSTLPPTTNLVAAFISLVDSTPS